MDIEQAYFSVSRYFSAWARVMELHTRRMEVNDSAYARPSLIISPPTDPGIPLLVNANRKGETTLLCFSERLKQIALASSRKRRMEPLDIRVAPFFRLPFKDGELAAIYANCFFDFCREQDFAPVLDEMRRVLKMSGSLYMVFMAFPGNIAAQGWSWAFQHFTSLSQGCHPVSLVPHLSPHGFLVQKDLPSERLGFPLRYVVAKKQAELVQPCV